MTQPPQGQMAHLSRSGQANCVDSRLLTMVTGNLNRQIDNALSSEALSAEQWRVLEYLDESGPCTMSSLAQATGASGATLTRVIDRLVSRALVYRSADGNDRRRVLVRLSDRGEETTDRLRPVVRAAASQTVARLSADEQEEFTRLLRLMV